MRVPKAILTGGGAAVGKTTAIRAMYSFANSSVIWQDCDIVRRATVDDNYEQATTVNRAIYRLCIEHHLSMLIDGTMARHGDRVIQQIYEMVAVGYLITIVFFTCDLETALKRNLRRDLVLPDEWIRDSPKLAMETFERAKPLVSVWHHFDTSSGKVCYVDGNQNLERKLI